MMKKTLIGVGLTAAVMIPAGLAVAQPTEDDADTTTTTAVRDHNREQRHESGECEFADGETWEYQNQDGERIQLQYREQQDEQAMNGTRAQIHEPGEGPGEGVGEGVRQGPMRDGSGEQAGSQGQRGPNNGR